MKLAALILISAAITACISGMFGMAGGMIFMGIIASVMGVAEAMVVHGVVQSVSNSYRSYLLRPDIRWDILGFELIGALPAIALLALVSFVPNKATLFIVLGFLPFILWLPKGVFQGDAAKPSHAILCGAKIVYFGLPLIAVAGLTTLPPLWVLAAAVPCIMIGTFIGTRILHRFSDIGFKSYTKYLVTIVGIIYLWRGLSLAALI